MWAESIDSLLCEVEGAEVAVVVKAAATAVWELVRVK